MLALMIILVLIERMLPPWPFLPPQFGRIGLANVVVMYTLFFIGKKEAVVMAFLKALFSVVMRGPMAGLLSLAGGQLSILIIIMLSWVFKKEKPYAALSVGGAIGHNIGQLAVAGLILQSVNLVIFYFPILLIAGAVFGTATGILLKVVMPAFKSVFK